MLRYGTQTGGVEVERNAMKVFVAEDSPEIRKRLLALLRTVPEVAVVGEAESVGEAIAGVVDSACDVVLLDLQLADGSGLEVLPQVKAQRPSVRVIVLTNFAMAQYREASLAAGADVFLDKSREFGRVPEVLREWLGPLRAGLPGRAN
jgi:DNA-binding NarL/FixJ family response regulator